MIPPELKALAREIGLHDKRSIRIRIAFGIACVERVEHLLTNPNVVQCLETGKKYILGEANDMDLAHAATNARSLASSHPGSGSLDGSGNAAVSVSHGVSAALAGDALGAAEYAAYARVYSYASYAVTDLANYADEHAWQVATLERLAAEIGYITCS